MTGDDADAIAGGRCPVTKAECSVVTGVTIIQLSPVRSPAAEEQPDYDVLVAAAIRAGALLRPRLVLPGPGRDVNGIRSPALSAPRPARKMPRRSKLPRP